MREILAVNALWGQPFCLLHQIRLFLLKIHHLLSKGKFDRDIQNGNKDSIVGVSNRQNKTRRSRGTVYTPLQLNGGLGVENFGEWAGSSRRIIIPARLSK